MFSQGFAEQLSCFGAKEKVPYVPRYATSLYCDFGNTAWGACGWCKVDLQPPPARLLRHHAHRLAHLTSQNDSNFDLLCMRICEITFHGPFL